MSILVVRVFVKLSAMLAKHRQLAAKLAQLERKLSTHGQIFLLLEAIRELAELPALPARRIGFARD